ncbi:MAG: hypothetical protein WBC78_14050, partial [Candidatus Sulfotelmatobacter sp.]
ASYRAFIFFLTSFFINSIQSISCNKTSVADFSMNNGRENRNNGNQEKGKEEKEALRGQYKVKKGGRQKRPLSFCAEVCRVVRD